MKTRIIQKGNKFMCQYKWLSLIWCDFTNVYGNPVEYNNFDDAELHMNRLLTEKRKEKEKPKVIKEYTVI